MVTFRVDAVDRAPAPLPVSPLGKRLRSTLALGGDPATPLVAHGGVHPVLAAVGLAFAQHRDLVLSPDAIWLTIAQGVARHVRLHAETLRSRLVRHQGTKHLTVPWCGPMPTDPASWSAVVSGLRDLLADEIGDGPARLFECDFSTSTEIDRTASQIVLLDAYSPYFSYGMMCVCGIPSITLTGTVEDWRRLRQRIDVVAELDLRLWCRSLAPILDQFVRAAGSDVDVAFWRRIYNPVDAYGGKVITGWITRLYPYLKVGGAMSTPNPMLELPIDEPRNRTSSRGENYHGPGISSAAVPDVASRVTVHVVDQVAQEQRPVWLYAGLVGVTQSAEGALCPIAGWYLEPARVDPMEVVDRIRHEHRAVVATTDHARPRFMEGPVDVIALFDQLASATLFDGDRAWRIRPVREHDSVPIQGSSLPPLRRIIDLPGGRSLCYVTEVYGPVLWLICRVSEPPQRSANDSPRSQRSAVVTDSLAEISVLGDSLATILNAALDTSGDVERLELCRLDQLLEMRRKRLRL